MSTGYLIVQQGGRGDRVMIIPPEGLLIGRGEDATLRLNNVSVSRHHAQLTVDGRRFFLADLGSGNGTSVNLEPLTAQPRELAKEDTIQLGSFKLVFLVRTGRAFPSWRGRFVNQLPSYLAQAGQEAPAAEATFGLDRATLRRMAEADHRRDSARIVPQGGAVGRAWHPGERTLVFGRGAQIPLGGWLTAARAAKVSWASGHHVIEPLSWWTRCTLNGSPLTAPTRLSSGARIRVGSTLFRYEVPALSRARDKNRKPEGGGRRETFTLPPRRD